MPRPTFGQKIADRIVQIVGSWPFILWQTSLISFWVLANTTEFLPIPKWDPYPFIFLNLALSFQAAYTAPIIMMSQNRAAQKDRQRMEKDFSINRLAEKENKIILAKLETMEEKILNHHDVKQDLGKLYMEIQSFQKFLNQK